MNKYFNFQLTAQKDIKKHSTGCVLQGICADNILKNSAMPNISFTSDGLW